MIYPRRVHRMEKKGTVFFYFFNEVVIFRGILVWGGACSSRRTGLSALHGHRGPVACCYPWPEARSPEFPIKYAKRIKNGIPVLHVKTLP